MTAVIERYRWLCLALAGVLWLGTSSPSWADEADDETETVVEEAADEPEEVDPFEVPDGSAAELVEYIDGLLPMRPQARDMAGLLEFHKKRATALMQAAEKVLAAKPTDEQRASAVQAKLVALSIQVQVGDESALESLKTLAAELKKDGLDELAKTANNAIFQTELSVVRGASAEEAAKLFKRISTFLSENPIGIDEAQLAMRAAQTAEQLGDAELALKVYRDFGAILSENENEMIVGAGRMMEASGRRLGLMGNEMELHGLTTEGQPLNWKGYRGKVVLVDFWATWCGPCIGEIPNMLQLYEQYHDRGFDIVGISVDEDPQALASFLSQRELPWTIVADQDPGAAQNRTPVSEYYGISSIPCMILVGKDGKVVSLEARGPALGQMLTELLGPIEEETEEEAEEEADEG